MKYILTILSFLIIPLFFPSPLKELSVTDDAFDKVITEPEPLPEEILLEQMSPEEKVGQLFIFGFDGTVLSKETKAFFQEIHLGGVLLLSKNISTEQQLKNLILDIQETTKIPLFIAIDQEGGLVSRIQWDERLTISQKEIDGPKESYTAAKERGEILKGYGINMNLAPVVEYIEGKDSFMYSRVYDGNLDQVVEKSVGAIEGYTDAGIIAVPKHFPGHSNTIIDPHSSLPVVTILEENWEMNILPFSRILNETTVDALMVGHIKYPNIDDNSSSLSSEILEKRLIEDLGYEGLIISDDMEMGALDNLGSYTDIAKKALDAGNDILIYSKYSKTDIANQRNVYEYILEEVKNGNMNIDEKVLKILKTKIKYGIVQ